jgi:type I restriction enzyme S subunit
LLKQNRQLLESQATGSTYKELSAGRLKKVEFPIPPLPIQRRIASILSAYDDLIQNNLRRIKLLEESARLLYKEWFVRLRFPGHEHTRIINGVPEGWERKRLGEVIELRYGKSLKESDRVEGPYPVYGSSGIIGSHSHFLVKGPGIIVGRKGNAGTVFWSCADFFPIDTVYYIDSNQSSYYLFHNLQHQSFQSSHGAVPGLNREYAYSLPILIPNKVLKNQFQETVSPAYEQIFKLTTINQKLRQARDILLPKLMSGEVEVGYDIMDNRGAI